MVAAPFSPALAAAFQPPSATQKRLNRLQQMVATSECPAGENRAAVVGNTEAGMLEESLKRRSCLCPSH